MWPYRLRLVFAVTWLTVIVLGVKFTSEVTLGEMIGILIAIVILVPPMIMWLTKGIRSWWRNHAYTLYIEDETKVESLDPRRPLSAMSRRVRLGLGEHHLLVSMRCNRNRQIIERWFWFEDLSRKMLFLGVVDIHVVRDLTVGPTKSGGLYEPKPPEIEQGEPQGVGYPTGEDEHRGQIWELHMSLAAQKPVDGFLVVKCKDSGGDDMYGRARIKLQGIPAAPVAAEPALTPIPSPELAPGTASPPPQQGP